jgi:hypothetical protein
MNVVTGTEALSPTPRTAAKLVGFLSLFTKGTAIVSARIVAIMSLAIIIFSGLARLGTYMLPMGLYGFGPGFSLFIKGIRAARA